MDSNCCSNKGNEGRVVTLTTIEAVPLDVGLETRYNLVRRRDCSERVNLALPTLEDALIA